MMLYVVAAFAAVILVGGVLFLLGRGAERRERRGRHRRGLRAGAGVEAGGSGADYSAGGNLSYVESGNCDSGGGGGSD